MMMMMKNSKQLLVLALCGLTIAAVGLGGCGKGGKGHEGSAKKEGAKADTVVVKVVVADVKDSSFEDWGSYSADLRGIHDAVLTAPAMGGKVNSIVPVGTRVKTGDALADIDSAKYEAAFEAAKAQIALTKGDLERTTANVDKGSLGKAALDGANLAYQNARMLLEGARRTYEDSRVQAPFDGMVVSRFVEPFQATAPGTPVVRLCRIDQLEAVIAIPETEAFSYKEGMKTEFHLLQNPNKAYTGRLASLDRAIDSRSRTVSARIVVGNSDGSLRPGMIGRGRILRQVYSKAIVIPSSAILRLQNGSAIMVVENNIARQRVITVGPSTESSTLVLSGLNAGDKLVVTGAFQVSDGTKVKY